jgi:hypothetical protein
VQEKKFSLHFLQKKGKKSPFLQKMQEKKTQSLLAFFAREEKILPSQKMQEKRTSPFFLHCKSLFGLLHRSNGFGGIQIR